MAVLFIIPHLPNPNIHYSCFILSRYSFIIHYSASTPEVLVTCVKTKKPGAESILAKAPGQFYGDENGGEGIW